MLTTSSAPHRDVLFLWSRLAVLVGLAPIWPLAAQPAHVVKAYAVEMEIVASTRGSESTSVGPAVNTLAIESTYSAAMSDTQITDTGEPGVLGGKSKWTAKGQGTMTSSVKYPCVGKECEDPCYPVVFVQKTSVRGVVPGVATLRVSGAGPYHWVFSDTTKVEVDSTLTPCKGPAQSGTGQVPITQQWRIEGDSDRLLIQGKITHTGAAFNSGAGETKVEITYKFTPLVLYVEPEDAVCTAAGSVIGCENQSLGEVVPITGTPFRLHYQSDRVAGGREANPNGGLADFKLRDSDNLLYSRRPLVFVHNDEGTAGVKQARPLVRPWRR